jgi:CheY-like chemotaxis protein
MNIPVIFCTANTDDFVKNRAVKINPEGYIKKPIIEHELFGMIKKVLADRVQAGK